MGVVLLLLGMRGHIWFAIVGGLIYTLVYLPVTCRELWRRLVWEIPAPLFPKQYTPNLLGLLAAVTYSIGTLSFAILAVANTIVSIF